MPLRATATDMAFTPAAGLHWLTPCYDTIIARLTREEVWRGALVAQIDPGAGDLIADIGCGTGSLLARLAAAEPLAAYVGIDPDPEILDRARIKLRGARATATLFRGFGHDSAGLLGGLAVTKLVSSLVLHQVPMAEKIATLCAMFDALPPGGELHIADYARQSNPLMRLLFGMTVQLVDGCANTSPQTRGVLPRLIAEAGFVDVVETRRFDTLTGSISLFRAARP